MNLQSIQEYCQNNKIRWTKHILTRMAQRNIAIDDIKSAISNGEIIEDYPDDYPDPSCLILGFSNNIPIHVVCGIHDDELWMITSYIPTHDEWMDDHKTRKE